MVQTELSMMSQQVVISLRPSNKSFAVDDVTRLIGFQVFCRVLLCTTLLIYMRCRCVRVYAAAAAATAAAAAAAAEVIGMQNNADN